MGQSGSSTKTEDTSNTIYVPVYGRPTWPSEEWRFLVETRHPGFSGKEVGYTHEEATNLVRRLKQEVAVMDIDSYVKHRAKDLADALHGAMKVEQRRRREASRSGTLQRTVSQIKAFKKLSPKGQKTQRAKSSSKDKLLTRTVSGDEPNPERLVVFQKQTTQKTTVHEAELIEQTTPDPVSAPTDEISKKDSFELMFKHMRIDTDDGEYKRICEDVSSMLDNTLWFLKRTYRAFQDCDLLRAGSVADGTKIGRPDEFDIVLLLPFLEQSVQEIKILEDSRNEFVRLSLVCDEPEGINGDQFTCCLKGQGGEQLADAFYEALRGFLRPSWNVVSMETKSFVNRIHLVLDSKSSGKLDVRFDISLAIPVSCNKIVSLTLNDPENVIKLPLWNHVISCLQDYEGKVFALIPGGEAETNRRISLALAEREQLHRFGEDSGVVKCLQCCKIIVAVFFPLVQVNDSWEAFIPPFLLKNAIFFLLEQLNDPEMWFPDIVLLRVVEVFMLLQRSLWPEDFGSRGSRISLFVFPGFTSFPEFSNDSCHFDSNEMKMKDDLTHSFQAEQISFPCKFPHEEARDFLLQKPEVSQSVGPYFQRLKSGEWKFRELLNDLVVILKDVFGYSMSPPWDLDLTNNNS